MSTGKRKKAQSGAEDSRREADSPPTDRAAPPVDEATLKLLEVSAGAAIAALVPLKILIHHLIKSGELNQQALSEDFEKGLNVTPYQGEIRAMLEPIWASLKGEIGHE